MFYSKFGLTAAALLLVAALHAQSKCTAITLSTLQVIENAAPDQKESKILSAGFDLRQAVLQKDNVTKVYSKCWVVSGGKKDYFEHKLFWDAKNDSIKLAMLNEQDFQGYRKELDERHPSGAGASVVVGKKFTYYLGFEKIDNMDYYTLTLVKN